MNLKPFWTIVFQVSRQFNLNSIKICVICARPRVRFTTTHNKTSVPLLVNASCRMTTRLRDSVGARQDCNRCTPDGRLVPTTATRSAI